METSYFQAHIKSHGREYIAKYYGVQIKHSDKELAKAILEKMGSNLWHPGKH